MYPNNQTIPISFSITGMHFFSHAVELYHSCYFSNTLPNQAMIRSPQLSYCRIDSAFLYFLFNNSCLLHLWREGFTWKYSEKPTKGLHAHGRLVQGICRPEHIFHSHKRLCILEWNTLLNYRIFSILLCRCISLHMQYILNKHWNIIIRIKAADTLLRII